MPWSQPLEADGTVVDTEGAAAEEAILAHLELAAAEPRDALLATLRCRPQDPDRNLVAVFSLELLPAPPRPTASLVDAGAQPPSAPSSPPASLPTFARCRA